MGPYYLTALVQTFGSVKRVAALGSKSRDTRIIGSGPKAGEEFAVTVPTHVSAIAEFENGESSQSIFSCDSPLKRYGFVEITGIEGTIAFPDPNIFDGDVRICAKSSDEWTTVPAVGSAASRGTGVLEMARAIREGRPHRAQGELAYHVVDTMVSISESIELGSLVDVQSKVAAVPVLPEDWDPTEATA